MTVSDYIRGLLTLPSIGIAYWLLLPIIRDVCSLKKRLNRNPHWLHDEEARQRNAAAILTARRVAAVRLPGSVFLMWRSNVPWHDETVRGVFQSIQKSERERGDQ